MKLLIIKTSSMGDVIHTFPAIMDAKKAFPDLTIDWVVEERFAYLPQWHPAINKVIPIALRRWRKQRFNRGSRSEIKNFIKQLRSQKYDVIIDAQGLLKSALWAWLAKGKVHGYDYRSAREKMAAIFYQHRYAIPFNQLAVNKSRKLFAAALNYPVPTSLPQYGFNTAILENPIHEKNYILLFHSTTWTTKHWPESYWRELIECLAARGEQVLLAWGNTEEKARAERLVAGCPRAKLIPELSIQGVAGVIKDAKCVVAVDTGFAHLTEALDIPMVSLYGPTDPKQTGPIGVKQKALAAEFPCAPCFSRQCSYTGVSAVQPACFSSLPVAKVMTAIDAVLSIKQALGCGMPSKY